VFSFSGIDFRYKTSFVRETAHLLCGDGKKLSSPVDWLYQQSLGAKARRIISAEYTANGGFEGRLNSSGSTLIINNVKKSDNGIYICVENYGTGTEHKIVLTVEGKFSE